jgi:hypothetical protein
MKQRHDNQGLGGVRQLHRNKQLVCASEHGAAGGHWQLVEACACSTYPDTVQLVAIVLDATLYGKGYVFNVVAEVSDVTLCGQVQGCPHCGRDWQPQHCGGSIARLHAQDSI